MKVIVDDAGRIELPHSVQTQLGIKPGDELVLEDLDGQWVIKSVGNPVGLAWKGEVLVHYGTCDRPVDRLVDEMRDERLEGLSEGLPR
ncbi:MAG: AbrB/MazE/SpoVT family DNA-binding domain-containing protein [Thermoguttaceae bacterium]